MRQYHVVIMMQKPIIVCVSGFSKTGKTTLIEKFITRLTKRGYTVVTVKHTQHDVNPPSGSDTRRHWDAGANSVILIGPSTSTITQRGRLEIGDIIKKIKADFLLIEGMKQSNYPKIWCVGNEEIEVPENSKNVVAVVTWRKDFQSIHHKGIPVFHISAVDELLSFILERMTTR